MAGAQENHEADRTEKGEGGFTVDHLKQKLDIASARHRGAQVYTVEISRSDADGERAIYTVQEYEVKDGVLTLAVDQDHDIVIPLFQVVMVDIQKHK